MSDIFFLFLFLFQTRSISYFPLKINNNNNQIDRSRIFGVEKKRKEKHMLFHRSSAGSSPQYFPCFVFFSPQHMFIHTTRAAKYIEKINKKKKKKSSSVELKEEEKKTGDFNNNLDVTPSN